MTRLTHRECSEEACDRPARARGLCTKHYQRLKSSGDPNLVRTTAKTGPLPSCSVPDCSSEARNHTSPFCEKHYSRNKRHGSPDVILKDHTPAVERWKTSYEIDPKTGCWKWTGRGNTRKGGYGLVSDGAAQSSIPAHVFVYEQVVGPVPEGMELDHLCNDKGCVNPQHLEPVTRSENARRIHERGTGEDTPEKKRVREAKRKARGSNLTGPAQPLNSAKRYCVNGHKFTEANTYIHPTTGWRTCVACRNRRMREGNYRSAYVYLWRPQHPLADRSGKVQEHRMVLYDDVGPGPHECHWGCGQVLEWGGIGGIQVDHLNGDPSDNRRDNLVPSCQSCNKSRASCGNLTGWKPSIGGHHSQVSS